MWRRHLVFCGAALAEVGSLVCHRGKRSIPISSYTLATAISFSRITESAHFLSDVWPGSALWFTIAKYQTFEAEIGARLRDAAVGGSSVRCGALSRGGRQAFPSLQGP